MSILSDALVALRVEINAALTALEPQIRGLDDLAKVSLSTETRAAVTKEGLILQRRRQLLNNVIAALDALEEALAALYADGYPEVPESVVSAQIFAELVQQQKDLDAAFAQFQAESPVATDVKVVLGQPVPK